MSLHFLLVVTVIVNAELKSYEEFYRAGRDAYLDENWENCVEYFESALSKYASYKKEVIRCRSGCDGVVTPGGQVTDLTDFFESVVKIALCNLKCEKEIYLDNLPVTDVDLRNDLDAKVPYDYLQLCYFKLGDVQKAASSAYTFLVHHPNHEIMQNNVKFYANLPSISMSDVSYLEDGEFQRQYQKATLLYANEAYREVIEAMERAVFLYLAAEDECRYMCEGPWLPGVTTSFYISIANYFAHTLRCKVNCPNQIYLSITEHNQSIFASHYHYLQYSYYRVGDLRNTCRSVASFLLLEPNNAVMEENRKFFMTVDGVREDWFQPRPEVVAYHKRNTKEKELFKFIENSFGEMEDANADSEPHSLSSIEERIKKDAVLEKVADAENGNLLSNEDARVVLSEAELNGTLRFVADGFASDGDCRCLVHLASDGATNGDGYNGRLSPHTDFESFEGLTVSRALTLTQRGLLDPSEVQLLLNVSEKARHYVQSYFKLESNLYFAYTHLVCRTALSELPGPRIDLSHPIHADNCVLTKNGECLKKRPAYVWRDYSAILYLNEDFQGGEFIFARSKETVEATVKPKCGRVVAFSAGKENLHGVQAVLKGRRCAVAMWYTLDQKHQEKERASSEKLIADLVRNKRLMDEDIPQLKPNSREKTLLQPPTTTKELHRDDL